MYKKYVIGASAIPDLAEKLIEFAKQFEIACILDSHSISFNSDEKFNNKEYDLPHQNR